MDVDPEMFYLSVYIYKLSVSLFRMCSQNEEMYPVPGDDNKENSTR